MFMDSNTLQRSLETLGSYLSDKGLQYEVVAIGGGALLLLGCIIRPTKDLDIVALMDRNELISAHPLPAPLLTAIREVGSALKLPADWVNSAPADLWRMGLPEGFQERLDPLHYSGLTPPTARAGLIRSALNYTHRSTNGLDSKHFEDLKRLKPTPKELQKSGNLV